MGKYIFIDIDGTLVNEENKVSQKNKEAIDKARSNGHRVYLCTGRAKCSTTEVRQQLNLDGYICAGGSYIVTKEECIYASYLESPVLQKIRDVLEEYQLGYGLEGTNTTYMTEGIIYSFFEHSKLTKKEIESKITEIKRVYNVVDIQEYQGEPIHKVCCNSKTKEALLKAQELLKDEFTFINHGINDAEILKNQLSKASAIQLILEHMGAKQQDTIAIGDSMNDFEMVQFAQIGIAVANAKKELIEVADMVVCDFREDAIHDAFIKLNLI
ncbi:Cof-type HAD-IIB family hydrolase [Tannockella kyphosi]|uniref:Cof-type HAD-IIB family hydrolase n=1 Tax=Tannockella kyphosi TaxID=2899121 RepID=UPI002010F032|nr:Cof-type HAD-IIB family hydrolase [Tannockella kyphosi]